MALTPLSGVILGVVLALWLGAAVWALSSGQRRRREGMQAQGKFDRLSVLLASAPAAPIVIHPDGRLEAADRLAKWLGKDRVPTFVSEFTAPDGQEMFNLLQQAAAGDLKTNVHWIGVRE